MSSLIYSPYYYYPVTNITDLDDGEFEDLLAAAAESFPDYAEIITTDSSTFTSNPSHSIETSPTTPENRVETIDSDTDSTTSDSLMSDADPEMGWYKLNQNFPLLRQSPSSLLDDDVPYATRQPCNASDVGCPLKKDQSQDCSQHCSTTASLGKAQTFTYHLSGSPVTLSGDSEDEDSGGNTRYTLSALPTFKAKRSRTPSSQSSAAIKRQKMSETDSTTGGEGSEDEYVPSPMPTLATKKSPVPSSQSATNKRHKLVGPELTSEDEASDTDTEDEYIPSVPAVGTKRSRAPSHFQPSKRRRETPESDSQTTTRRRLKQTRRPPKKTPQVIQAVPQPLQQETSIQLPSPQQKRRPPPPRNIQCQDADIKSLLKNAESFDFACPICDWKQINSRLPDFRRHIQTHNRKPDFVCKGVPLQDAGKYGVPLLAEPYLFFGEVRIGGCRKSFSRADALGRHFKSCNTRCVREI